LDSVLLPGALMRAAQMAGAMERVLALTVQYAKDRVQFGKPIGAYQAIQQQLAVLAGQSAAATRAVDAAFETAARGDDLFFDVAVAKIRAGEAAGVAASVAHQVHGAIGFTDEHVLHYFTRRLWTWRAEFGSESFWARRLGTHALSELGPDRLWPAVTNAR
jgi:alkylation response protein AidB-like acyl-CoA dehydrogenase